MNAHIHRRGTNDQRQLDSILEVELGQLIESIARSSYS